MTKDHDFSGHGTSHEAEGRSADLDRLRGENRSLRDRLARCEAQLAAAGRAAEAADIAKNEFLANMGHELRTPINGILGMIDLAMATRLSPEQIEFLDIARSSGRYLMRVMEDILDFSLMEAGGLVLDSSPFSLRESLREIVGGLEAQARHKGLGFAFWIADDAPDGLVGDAARLRQVVRSLADNALKYTDKGIVEIMVEPDPAPEDPDWAALRFSVRDTGTGIAADKHVRIFAPFTQSDSSNTRRHGGTGLGLALVDRLVRAMGGAVSIDSELGRGSTFTFTVRLRRIDEIPADLPAAPDVALGTNGDISDHGCQDGASPVLTILLAEDDAINQQVATRLLAKHGYAVTVAGTGREAVELFRQGRFDLVLMDIQMPEMDGLEAARAIRRMEGETGRHVPIVAMTAFGRKGERDRCLAAGMDEFMAKPIRSRDLLVLVQRLTGDGDRECHVVMPNPETEVILDRQEILSRLDNDISLLGRIVDMYFDQAPEQVEDIRRRIEARDANGLERAAHKLKGSVGYFGARKAVAAALALEDIGRRGDFAAAGPALEVLEQELARFSQALKVMKKENAA